MYILTIVLLPVKRNTLILYSYFHQTFMFLLLVSVTQKSASYQNPESQMLGLITLLITNGTYNKWYFVVLVVKDFKSYGLNDDLCSNAILDIL